MVQEHQGLQIGSRRQGESIQGHGFHQIKWSLLEPIMAFGGNYTNLKNNGPKGHRTNC